MSKTVFKTELFCSECNEDTIHEIIYLYEHVDTIKCLQCHKTIIIDEDVLLQHYSGELFNRIKTKPERLTEEFKEDTIAFMKTIPKRLITKPYRSYKEIVEFRNEYNSHKKNSD